MKVYFHLKSANEQTRTKLNWGELFLLYSLLLFFSAKHSIIDECKPYTNKHYCAHKHIRNNTYAKI